MFLLANLTSYSNWMSKCRQGLFCDCSILVEGKVFNTHQNVLFASSGYFKMFFSQSSKDTSQPTTATFHMFSPDTSMVILDCVYSGTLTLTGQNVIEVKSAASDLQMRDIICACKTFIKSPLDISEKEKGCYFSLSEKELNSNGAESPCLYRTADMLIQNMSVFIQNGQQTAVLHPRKWTDLGVSVVGRNS